MNWQQTTIDEACLLVTDGTHYTPPDVGQGIPFLTVKNFSHDGHIDLVGCSHITEDEFEKADRGNSAPKPGDVLFSKDGTVGKVYVVGTRETFAVLSSLAILRPDASRLDASYFGWVLKTDNCLAQASRSKTGSAIRRIILKDLKRVRFPLPPLVEQKRITGILDAADALRAKRRDALAQLDTLLQSTFLDMFGDPVTNPMGWEESRLEDVCEKVIDCPHSTPHWTESGVVCLRTSNLGKGEWIWADTRYVSEEGYTERTRRSEILPNDIILSREGTVGVLALVNYGMRLCMGQRLVQLRVNDSKLAPRFLLNLLLHSLAPERLSRFMAGSTSKHLNVKDLRKLPVLLPPLEVQQRFGAIAEAVERQKSNQRVHLAELDTLFASLQSRAFRGDL